MRLRTAALLAGIFLLSSSQSSGKPQSDQSLVARGSNVYGVGTGFVDDTDVIIEERRQPPQPGGQDQPPLPGARRIEPPAAPANDFTPQQPPVQAPLPLSTQGRNPQPNAAQPPASAPNQAIGLEEVDLKISDLTTTGQRGQPQSISSNTLGAAATGLDRPYQPPVIGKTSQTTPPLTPPSIDNSLRGLPPPSGLSSIGPGATGRDTEVVLGFERNSAQAGGEVESIPVPASRNVPGTGPQQQPQSGPAAPQQSPQAPYSSAQSKQEPQPGQQLPGRQEPQQISRLPQQQAPEIRTQITSQINPQSPSRSASEQPTQAGLGSPIARGGTTYGLGNSNTAPQQPSGNPPPPALPAPPTEVVRGGATYGSGNSNAAPPTVPSGNLNIKPEEPEVRDRVLSQAALPENGEDTQGRNAPVAAPPAPPPRPVAAGATTRKPNNGEGHHMGGIEWLPESIPGEPLVDYPVLSQIPSSGFDCKKQGYDGFFADTSSEARCQVFWVCHNEQQDGFLCPNGTMFHQRYFTCDWWFNVACDQSADFYELNRNIGVVGTQIDTEPAGVVAAASKIHPVFTLLSEMLRFPRVPPVRPRNHTELPHPKQTATQSPMVFETDVKVIEHSSDQARGPPALPQGNRRISRDQWVANFESNWSKVSKKRSAHRKHKRGSKRKRHKQGIFLKGDSGYKQHMRRSPIHINSLALAPENNVPPAPYAAGSSSIASNGVSPKTPAAAPGFQNGNASNPSVEDVVEFKTVEKLEFVGIGGGMAPGLEKDISIVEGKNDTSLNKIPPSGSKEAAGTNPSAQNVQPTPAPVQKPATPQAPGQPMLPPAPGQPASTQQPGKLVPPSVVAQPTPAPIQGQHTLSPIQGQPSPAPVLGQLAPSPMPGQPAPQPPSQVPKPTSTLPPAQMPPANGPQNQQPQTQPPPSQSGQQLQGQSRPGPSSERIPPQQPLSMGTSGANASSDDVAINVEVDEGGQPPVTEHMHIPPMPGDTPQDNQVPPSQSAAGNPQNSQVPPSQGAAGNPQDNQMPPSQSAAGNPQNSQVPPSQSAAGNPQNSQMPPSQSAAGNPQDSQVPPSQSAAGNPQNSQVPPSQGAAGNTQNNQVPPSQSTAGNPQNSHVPLSQSAAGNPQDSQVPPSQSAAGNPQDSQVPPSQAAPGNSQNGQLPPSEQLPPNQFPGMQPSSGNASSDDVAINVEVDEDGQPPVTEHMHIPPMPGDTPQDSQVSPSQNAAGNPQDSQVPLSQSAPGNPQESQMLPSQNAVGNSQDNQGFPSPNAADSPQDSEMLSSQDETASSSTVNPNQPIIDTNLEIERGTAPPVEEHYHFPPGKVETAGSPVSPPPLGSGNDKPSYSGPNKSLVSDPSALHQDMPSENADPSKESRAAKKQPLMPEISGNAHPGQVQITSESVSKITNPKHRKKIRDPAGLNPSDSSISSKIDKKLLQQSSKGVITRSLSKSKQQEKEPQKMLTGKEPTEEEVVVQEQIQEPDRSSKVKSQEPPNSVKDVTIQENIESGEDHQTGRESSLNMEVKGNRVTDAGADKSEIKVGASDTQGADSGWKSIPGPAGINVRVYVSQLPMNDSKSTAVRRDTSIAEFSPHQGQAGGSGGEAWKAMDDSYDYDFSDLPSWMQKAVKRQADPKYYNVNLRDARDETLALSDPHKNAISPVARFSRRADRISNSNKASNLKRTPEVQKVLQNARENLMGILGGPKEVLDTNSNHIVDDSLSDKDKRDNEIKLRFDPNRLTSFSDHESSWF